MHSQREFLQKIAKETKVRIGFATSSLSSLPSVGFSFRTMDAFSERIFTEDSEGNKGSNWVCNFFVIFASFCWIFFSYNGCILRENFYRRQRRKQRFELGLQLLRYLRFLLLDFLFVQWMHSQ